MQRRFSVSILRIIPALMILAVSCISPIEFKVPGSLPLLVVDGMITNDPGPYTVKLFKSFVIDDRYENPVTEFGAEVILHDDDGNQEAFVEVDRGVYQTRGVMQGQVGKSYYITIKTVDGKQYESEPETIQPAGQLNELKYSYISKIEVINGQEVPLRGFQIYVDGEAAGDARLLRWKMTGTYKILTFPELKTRITDRGTFPDPLPCSGYRVTERVGTNGIEQIGPCVCCTCWLNTFSERPVLSDDRFTQGQNFDDILVGFVPLDRRLFYEKFHVEVEQLSLNQNTYEFWQAVRDQKDGATSLFQPPNALARGNIKALTPDEEVLGLFSASGVSKRTLFLFPGFAPDLVLPIDTIRGSCLKVDPSATTNRPDFW
ncbi:MAG: hypothetical protein RL161_831 [Bacteroidota bacterium]